MGERKNTSVLRRLIADIRRLAKNGDDSSCVLVYNGFRRRDIFALQGGSYGTGSHGD